MGGLIDFSNGLIDLFGPSTREYATKGSTLAFKKYKMKLIFCSKRKKIETYLFIVKIQPTNLHLTFLCHRGENSQDSSNSQHYNSMKSETVETRHSIS